ncbi:MAG: hypothetical protein HZB13_04515 [Acidobacteria bacterium]|nr:hypothetical protein [Acidobacteriota bacterium]
MSSLPVPRAPKDAIFFEVHPPSGGFHRYLFRQGRFPVKPAARARWIDLYSRLRPLLFAAASKTVTALQMWHLHHDDGPSILTRNAGAWSPDYGVGVWLHQPPPTLWQPEEFEMLGPGDPMRPPILTAIALTAERLDHHGVWVSMGCRGCYVEFSVTGSPEEFLEAQAPLYQAWIEEPLIAAHGFFIPLLSLGVFDSDLFTQRLAHVAPVGIYVRESDEDEGLLILSRDPVESRITAALELVPWTSPDPAVRIALVQQIKA